MEYDPSAYAVHDDPYPTYRWLRDEAPLYRNDRLDFWALSRFDDVADALADPATYSSAQGTQLESGGESLASQQEMILLMDPPRHSLVRKLVSRAFTPRRVSELEPRIRGLCSDLLAPVGRAGGGDLVAEFAGALPMTVIGMLVGIDPVRGDEVRGLADRINHREPGSVLPPPDAQVAGIDLYRLFLDLVRVRRPAPADDLLGDLLAAEITEGGATRRLDDHQIVMFCVLLALAGYETTTKLIANLVVELAEFPEARAALLAGAPVAAAVEESLRFDTPSQYQGRVTTRPVRIHDGEIPPSSRVLLINGSANRDERIFAEPDRFDVRRSIDRHISFGQGPHYCIGASLARLEALAAIEELLVAMPGYRVDLDGVERRHSSNFRGLSRVPVIC